MRSLEGWVRGWHRRIALVAGVFLLFQAASGIGILAPLPAAVDVTVRSAAPLEVKEAVVAPAEAIRALEGDLEAPLDVRSLRLRRIGDALVYEIDVAGRSVHRVDARSGATVAMTPELATAMVRAELPFEAPVLEARRIERHDRQYPRGRLPAYRVTVAGRPGWVSHVSVRDGRVSHSTRWTRARSFLVSFHDLSVFEAWIPWRLARRGLLVTLGGVAFLAATSGYLLALSQRRRRARKT